MTFIIMCKYNKAYYVIFLDLFLCMKQRFFSKIVFRALIYVHYFVVLALSRYKNEDFHHFNQTKVQVKRNTNVIVMTMTMTMTMITVY